MNLATAPMRKLLLLILTLPLQMACAQEEFREWMSHDGKQGLSALLKSLYPTQDIEAGRLVDYDSAFSMEELNFADSAKEWVVKHPANNGEDNETSLRVIKMEVRIYPPGTDPKKRDKVEPELRELDLPMAFVSQADQEYVLDWDWLRQWQPFFDQCLQVVLGEKRGLRKTRSEPEPRFDIIYLRNGSKMRGVVQNTAFALHAGYGRFAVPRDKLAAVQFGDGKGGDDLLVGVNNNRFSGILDLPADPGLGVAANQLTITNEAGQAETFRKEKVSRIVFRVRSDELDSLGVGDSVLVRLKNGDAFDARVSGGEFKIGTRSIPVGEVSRVEILEGRANLLMKSGGRDVGDFSEEDIPMELSLGPTFNLYRAHLGQIYCEPGFRPVGKILPAKEPRAISVNFERDGPPGVLRTISRTSAYYGILKAGDRIVSIDGRIPDFESKDTTYELVLDALFVEKTASHFVLTAEREGRTFTVTVVNME